jgi:hypothetical protein
MSIRETKTGHIVSFSDTDLEILIPFKQSGFKPGEDLNKVVNEHGVTVASWLSSAARDGAGRVYRKATY